MHTLEQKDRILLTLALSSLFLLSTVASTVPGAAGGPSVSLMTTSNPPPSTAPAATFDPIDGYVVLFGGVTGFPGTDLAETWTFCNGTWTQIHPLHSPPPTNGAQLAFDAADGYVVMHELDYDAQGQPWFAQTWSFVRGDWTNLTATAGSEPPLGAGSNAMDYDPIERAVLLATSGPPAWGLNQTWMFAGGKWTNRTTPSGPPAVGSTQWDADLGSLVFVGGGELFANRTLPYCNDTWLYHAGTWTQTGWPTPCFLHDPSMVYDAHDHEMVLYGGGWGACGALPCNATWTLNGTNWTSRVLTPSPDTQGFSAMAYDAADQEVVLFGGMIPGGTNGFTRLDTTWVYSAGAWRNVTAPEVGPTSGLGPVLAYGIAVSLAGAVGIIALVVWRRRKAGRSGPGRNP